MGMTDDILRKKNTGEPGPRGQFGTHDHSSPEALLTSGRYAFSTPAEIDKDLAAYWGEQQRLNVTIAIAQRDIEDVDKQPKRYVDPEKTKARLRERIAGLVAEHEKFQALMDPLNEEFDARGGWSRFFLVMNSNGHVHSSMHCSTCEATTQFGWLTDHSGKDEAQIVEAAGDMACTVCFPTAPVADKNHPRPNSLQTPEQREAREAREAAKAEREAKRLKTGIWNPDGGELREAGRGQWSGNIIKTERAAEIQAVDFLNSQMWSQYHADQQGRPLHEPNEYDIQRTATFEMILPALAAKRGQTVDEVRALVTEKAEKKFKREMRS